ncbi:MAG: L,D-transpeptidase [Patescibacteria group bacterium]
MKASSLEHKTIRPGSLNGFNYYHSDRHPSGSTGQSGSTNKAAAKPKKSLLTRRNLLIVATLLFGIWFVFLRSDGGAGKQVSKTPATNNSTAKPAPAVAAKKPDTHCVNNELDKLILISVSKRHLWACEGSKTVHSSAAITGNQLHDETLTPVGTYKIYAKQTDTVLTGTDVTGSWSRPVQYWMPFLDNVYGTYGFHDATWRPDSEFGRIDPSSDEASHGCIELPLASTKWLYEWSEVGTTVTVE